MSWAIVIPGNGRADSGGTYRLTDRCRRCLDVAAELAELRMPRAVRLHRVVAQRRPQRGGADARAAGPAAATSSW